MFASDPNDANQNLSSDSFIPSHIAGKMLYKHKLSDIAQ